MFPKPLALAPLAMAAALGLAAPATGETVRTALGSVELEPPRTVAVYDIAALDTLAALGVPVAGVPGRLYLPRLESAVADAQIVGDIFEPDLEALNALAPDLVIVGTRSSPQKRQTERVAPTIDMTVDSTALLADAKARIEDYGALFGKGEAAAALISDLERDAEAARTAAMGKGNALIVMTNGPKISVYGPGSRFGWLHEVAGIPPAAADIAVSAHGEAASFEFIAEVDPDWLIVLDRAAAIGADGQGANATLDNALVRATKAWQRGQVIHLPAAELYIAAGGANATSNVLRALADGFSAEP